MKKKLGDSILLQLLTCQARVYPSFSLILWHCLSSKDISSKGTFSTYTHRSQELVLFCLNYSKEKEEKSLFFFWQSVYVLSPIFTSQAAEDRTGSLGEVLVVWKGCRVHKSKSARYGIGKAYRGQSLRCPVRTLL